MSYVYQKDAVSTIFIIVSKKFVSNQSKTFIFLLEENFSQLKKCTPIRLSYVDYLIEFDLFLEQLRLILF